MTDASVRPIASNEEVPHDSKKVAAGLRAAKGIKQGRVTSAVLGDSGRSASSQIKALFGQYASLAYQLPWEVLDYVELLATYNPDYSQAVENIKMLANSGHELIVDASSELQKKRTKALLEEKSRLIQESHGGIDGIIDKLLDQAATFGSMCGEWVLNDELTEVIDFVDLSPKQIRYFWDEDEQRYLPYQKVTAHQAEEARKSGQTTKGNHVKLNEITFRYYAFDAAPESPYGVPPFLAALANIAIQRDMVHNMAQIVKKIGLLGIIDMTIERLHPLPNESDEAYEARAGDYLDAYARVAEEMVRDGGMVHFDDVQATAWSIGGNAAGATNIHKANEEMVFSGLKSMPSVQGRCVVPETLVLTAAFEWVKAGDLALNQELAGFDQFLREVGQHDVSVRQSFVECVDRIELPCFRITTEQGSVLTASDNHPVVVWNGSDPEWREAQKIEVGDLLIKYSEEVGLDSVVSVEDVGPQEVVALQTSSRTFISETICSHNSYSTTETYAGVAYDIIIRNTRKYQRAAKRMIESGYWLMAMMAGLQPDKISLVFNENRSLNRAQEASAERIEIANAFMLWLLGILDQVGVSQRLGYSDPKTPMEEPPESLIGIQSAHGIFDNPSPDDFGSNSEQRSTVEKGSDEDDELETE